MIYRVFIYIVFMTLNIAMSFSANINKIDTIEQIDKHDIITPFEQEADNYQINPILSNTERKKLPIKRKRITESSLDSIKTKTLSRFQIYRLAIKARGPEEQKERNRKRRKRDQQQREALKTDPKAYRAHREKLIYKGKAWYASVKKDPFKLARRRELSKKRSSIYRAKQKIQTGSP